MTDHRLYGMSRLADHLGVSEETLRRWRKRPEGAFITVASMSNLGGGYGRAAWSYPKSLDNLKTLVKAATSEERRQAALARRRSTDPSSGSIL